jgi:hypothetical protein
MIQLFDINFVTCIFGGFDYALLSDWFSSVTQKFSECIFVLYSLIVLSISRVIILESRNADKIIKNIGRIGTGVLAGIGALDSSLNLYDRYKKSQSSSSSSSEPNNSGEGDDKNNKKSDNANKQSDNNSNSNTNNDSK